MTRLTLEQIFIKNLAGELPEGSMAYTTKQVAYECLKKYTGQDFGYEVEKWKSWIEVNGLVLLDDLIESSRNRKRNHE